MASSTARASQSSCQALSVAYDSSQLDGCFGIRPFLRWITHLADLIVLYIIFNMKYGDKKRNGILKQRREVVAMKLESIAKRARETIDYLKVENEKSENTSDIITEMIYLQGIMESCTERATKIKAECEAIDEARYEHGRRRHEDILSKK